MKTEMTKEVKRMRKWSEEHAREMAEGKKVNTYYNDEWIEFLVATNRSYEQVNGKREIYKSKRMSSLNTINPKGTILNYIIYVNIEW